MTTISFAAPVTPKGSNRTFINVSKNGIPFGQLWTFKARGERHGWHAKTIAGDYRLFDTGSKKVDGFDAMAWMNGF